jgi:hypothetical protein
LSIIRRYVAVESTYDTVGIAVSIFAGKIPCLFRQTGFKNVLKFIVLVLNNCNWILSFNGYYE